MDCGRFAKASKSKGALAKYLRWKLIDSKDMFATAKIQQFSKLQRGLHVLSGCTAVGCRDIREEGFPDEGND